MPKRNVSLSLDADLLERVERLAEPRGENRTQVIERLLLQGVRIAEDAELDALYDRALAAHPVTAEQQAALRARTRAIFRSAHGSRG